MNREEPNLEDYIAAGGLANVPLWIYLLLARMLLLVDYSSNTGYVTMFLFFMPIVVMVVGGVVASLLLCRRSVRRYTRIGILVGVTATIVSLIYPGMAESSLLLPVIAAPCYIGGAVFSALLENLRAKH